MAMFVCAKELLLLAVLIVDAWNTRRRFPLLSCITPSLLYIEYNAIADPTL